MIATLAFDPPRERIRRIRFVPRPNVPIDAACVVANGMREALRELLGSACALTIGEPAALDAAAWRTLSNGALLFVAPGRATDVIFVLAARDARRLVQAAFGEDRTSGEGAWSALETGAIERIVARCATACDALCVERRGPTSAADPARLPRPVAYLDVRIAAPIELTIGLAIVREIAVPPAAPTLTIDALGDVAVEVRVIVGAGQIPAPSLLALQTGTVVPLHTKVAGEGELNLAGHRIAFGTCGVRHSRPAFEVRYPT